MPVLAAPDKVTGLCRNQELIFRISGRAQARRVPVDSALGFINVSGVELDHYTDYATRRGTDNN